MRLPAGVYARGSVFWCRVVIPKDLRHLYPRTASVALPSTHSNLSLQTSNREEARVRGLARRAQVEAEFLEKRKASAPTPTIRPTAQLRGILSEAVYAAVISMDSNERAKFEGRVLQQLATQRAIGMPIDMDLAASTAAK